MTFISERHRLVLIRPHKTAGKSLSDALRDATGEPPKRYRGNVIHAHIRVRELLARFPELADFHVVAVIRDPWDRLVSYYHWTRAHEPAPPDDPRVAKLRSYGSFAEFVHDLHRTFLDPQLFDPWTMRYDPEVGAVNYPSQYTWLTRHGAVRVDHLGGFEQLSVTVRHLEEVTGLHLDLPHAHRTERPATADAYTRGMSEMVREIYRTDVDLGSYSPPDLGD